MKIDSGRRGTYKITGDYKQSEYTAPMHAGRVVLEKDLSDSEIDAVLHQYFIPGVSE